MTSIINFGIIIKILIESIHRNILDAIINRPCSSMHKVDNVFIEYENQISWRMKYCIKKVNE